ncbi:MAG: DNA polymerase IV [Neisseriaceae bacterium]
MNTKLRKIIHIDMDCFYAAIEMRDNPKLKDKPVAVGGLGERSVLCTANYIARKFGVRSAMPTQKAMQLCSDLVVLPVNMAKYKQVSSEIQKIFYQFTDLVEPLALDEAYLDVTNDSEFNNSATLIANQIKNLILQHTQLASSAGIAPNKFLAKIASGWEKPNGLYTIAPEQVENFMYNLPVEHLFGVGKVTLSKLHGMNIKTCNDLQNTTLPILVHNFGKFGKTLYYQSRGIDNRSVNPNRERKSMSVETTFDNDIDDIDVLIINLKTLYSQLNLRLNKLNMTNSIKNQFIKIKYHDFKVKTAEIASNLNNLDNYIELLYKISPKQSVRLLGIGITFNQADKLNNIQPPLF